MNAITKEQTLNVSQTARLGNLLHEATTGFKQKVFRATGNLPTDGEVATFAATITPSVKASILKADQTITVAKRDDRLKTVKALAEANGVKFTHRRETEEHETLVEAGVIDRNLTEEVILVESVNATRGGQTFAFKYVLDEKNNLSIAYTTAFCRDDENFDPLIGMEESLKKFLAGHVLSTPITHERFGNVKLAQLSNLYKEAEHAAKAFIAATAA